MPILTQKKYFHKKKKGAKKGHKESRETKN